MACADPITAWQGPHGGPLSFKPVRDGHYWRELQVPCGTCILCRQEQARQWAVRIAHEAQLHEANSFVTLTYADEHLPMYGSLNYRDLQLFFKRLRKRGLAFRYYAVGEYGDKTMRPHYHLCMFGQAFVDGRRLLRTEPTPLWTNPVLEEAWGLGHVSVGALTFQTASYTASYVTKKLAKKQKYVRVDPDTGELVPLAQPKALMSRGGRTGCGIAGGWYDRYGRGTYDHDRVVIDGTPQKPPKYYDSRLKKENEDALKQIKQQRMDRAEPSTPEQLRARARNAHARAKLKSKTV